MPPECPFTMVAFATRDGRHVDAELRSAPRVDVYAVTPTDVRLDHTCAFDGVGTGARIDALAGVDLVYVCAIGPSIAARLAMHGIQAATARSRIDVVLAHHHNVLRLSVREIANPPDAGRRAARVPVRRG